MAYCLCISEINGLLCRLHKLTNVILCISTKIVKCDKKVLQLIEKHCTIKTKKREAVKKTWKNQVKILVRNRPTGNSVCKGRQLKIKGSN